MRKFWISILSALTAVTAAFALVGCNDDGKTDEAKVDAVAATCTTAGNIEYWKKDGKFYADDSCTVELTEEDVTIEALGHIGGEATCSELAICVRCNTGYGEYKAHDFGEMKAEEPATCGVEGRKAHKSCKECKKKFDAEGVEIADLTIPATGAHTLGDLQAEVPANCGQDGTKAHKTCTVCLKNFESEGVELVDLTIPATGLHTFGNWLEATTPTCGDEGAIAHKDCTVCSKHFDEDGVELAADVYAIPATGEHVWETEGIVTTPANLIEYGEKTFGCENCDKTKVEPYKLDSEVSFVNTNSVSYVGTYEGVDNVYKFDSDTGYVIIGVNGAEYDFVEVKVYIPDTTVVQNLFVFSTCIGHTDNHDHDSEDHNGYYVGRDYNVIRASYVDEAGNGTTLKNGWNTIRIYTIGEQKSVKIYENISGVTWYASGDVVYGNTPLMSFSGVTSEYIGEFEGEEHVYAMNSGDSTNARINLNLSEITEYDYVDVKVYVPDTSKLFVNVAHPNGALFTGNVCTGNTANHNHDSEKKEGYYVGIGTYTGVKALYVDESGIPIAIKNGWNTIRIYMVDELESAYIQVNQKNVNYYVSADLTWGNELVEPDLKEMSFSGVTNSYIGEFEGEEHVYAMNSGDSTNARINLDLSKVSEYDYVDVKIYLPEGHGLTGMFTGNVCTGNTANHNHASEKKEGYWIGNDTYDSVKALYVDADGNPISGTEPAAGWNTIRIYMVDELQSAYIQVNVKNVSYYVSADLTWGNDA